MESVLLTTTYSSFRALEHMSSSPIDFHTFSLVSSSQTCSALTVERIWFFVPPPEKVWEEWEAWLPLNNEAKNLLSTSAFSKSVEAFVMYQKFSCLSPLTSVPVELITFHISQQAQFHLSLSFRDSTSACPDSIPISFSGHMSLFPLPVHFLLFPQFNQQVSHACFLLFCLISYAGGYRTCPV